MTGSGISSKEKHAVLGPSSAERWISCPASVRMAQTVPRQEESSYALEGTIAHALAEIEARFAFKMSTPAQHTRERNGWRAKWGVSEEVEEEMSVHVAGYVDLLLERAAIHPNTQLLLEQRVPTGVPSCWGTSDAVLVSPVHVEIVDFKYGAGVRVEAPGNPQLRLYGVGSLEKFGDLLGDTEDVTVTVYQPRMDHVDSEVLSAAELRRWRDRLIPIAELALGDDAPFGPSEDACRWCPAAGQCRAQLEWATALDFGSEPETLSPEEIAEAMETIPSMLKWAEAVKAAATALATVGNLPGYKMVRGNGRRDWTDAEAAQQHLIEMGHSLDEISNRKIKGLGELETLLGKKEFAEAMKPYLYTKPGNPALVPESDKRSAIDPNTEAAKEFGE